ncbi:MAG: hypothetical protein ACYTAF_06930, partial [Planctomycetota bacterium]
MKARFVVPFLFLALPVFAGGTKYWQVEKRESLAAGKELKNLVLTARGELRVGRESRALQAEEEPSFWAGLYDGKRETGFFGTGTGKIYRLDGGKLKLDFETGELLVTAFSPWRNDIYAATIPNGKILEWDGKWVEFAKLDAKYVWALLPTDDGLLAATGNEGKVFLVGDDGKAEVWFETKTENVLCMAKRGDDVLLGTAGPGRLIRVRDGKGFVVRDFEQNEVKSLSVGGDAVHAGVNTGTKKTPSEFLRAVQEKAEKKDPEKPAPPAKPAGKAPAPKSGTSFLWRFSGERSRMIASFPSSYITEIVATGEGVWVGTNNSGRVYRVKDDGSFDLLYDFDEKQVLAFLVEGGEVAGALTGDRAAVRLFTEAAEKGTYLSPVLDAKFPTNWGGIEWRGEGKVAVRTRSGNVKDPEAGWSDWSEPMAASPGKVASPKGRYLQVRVDLEGGGAVFRGFTLAYRSENQRPQVAKLVVAAAVKSGGGKAAAGPAEHTGKKNVTWQAADPDGDGLVFRLSYRPVGGETWVPLHGKPVKGKAYAWNTWEVPDGKYVVRIVASDEQANPADEALTGERTTDPILVDNTRPEVVIGSVKGGRVRAGAKDAA